MYAAVIRRTMNAARAQETMERAQAEFYPELRHAAGFTSLTLIQGNDGSVTSVIVFESQEHAQAFQPVATSWMGTLDELGHRLESQSAGHVLQYVTPED